MDFVVKIVTVFLLFLFLWFTQEEHQLWDLQRNELKKANNFAAHDAAQQIDKQQLASGRLIIDPVSAREEFERTLQLNLGLNENLRAKSGSPLHGEVRIIHFEIIDESNASFPYLYENQQYHIAKWLRGPAVISVIETDYTHLVQILPQPSDIRVPTIEEYVMNN